MYIVDLIKKLTNKQNIPVLIYLILNIFVTAFLLYLFPAMAASSTYQPKFLPFLAAGFIFYMISVVIALSPIGEFIIRLQTGCKRIRRVEQINFIEPLFREVYEKAKKADPSIPDDVQLFINSDTTPNAFATGRKTICVTEGLLHVPENQIKATLGHEFGHISHKDTDLIMLVSVGNLIVSGFILFIRAIIVLFQVASAIGCLFVGGSEGAIARGMTALWNAIITAIVGGLTKLWTKIGVWLVMKASRDNEYGADEFAFNLGYGNDLCIMLDSFDGEGATGLFATLESSHPQKDDRIAKLQQLGATYRTVYGAGTAQQKYTVDTPSFGSNKQVTPAAAMGFASGTATSQRVNDVYNISNEIACPACGERISAKSKFCPECGEKINQVAKHICPNCGYEADEDDAEFCIICGTKLEQ